MARKRKQTRVDEFSPVMFRRDIQLINNKDELLEALRFAGMEIKHGHPLPQNLDNALLRFLRAQHKRADASIIVNTVNELARQGYPVTADTKKGKTAFKAAAQMLGGFYPKGLTAKNVERIYHKAIREYVPKPEFIDAKKD
jgi:hypothetical protein